MNYTEFEKLDLDLSAVGWSKTDESDAPYFCTPKGAYIIGRAGVDGIHYCTVPTLGETVLAVSPMNAPGEYVHPIAADLTDLLRLLLACFDMNIIEQAWMWDKETLLEQIEATRNSEYFDASPLNALRERCGLEPMEEPYEYLCRLRSSFDYDSIPYTEEYYDLTE